MQQTNMSGIQVPNWDKNCHLGRSGSSYQNNAHYIVGVQRILRYSGFNPGASNDGKFGSQTESALRAYQNSSSYMPTTGVVDHATWQHMGRYKVPFYRLTQTYEYYSIQNSPKDHFAVETRGYRLHRTINMANNGWMNFDITDLR